MALSEEAYDHVLARLPTDESATKTRRFTSPLMNLIVQSHISNICVRDAPIVP